MRHKLLVLTVKKFLQSVYIYGSYRIIKTGVPFFLDHPVNILHYQSELDVSLKSLNVPSLTVLGRESHRDCLLIRL